ncbi:hypothetical protein D5086_032658 [Populus alba]|uniref:Uncharacterized protein n=2 Tax=Populus alba TaxID=43335 RepID=A0ACC4AEM5_POPAL|nr:hypothetical protein D5086_0000048570 [Populus alba]
MSGAPVKRSHEEGGHSSSLKFPPHEDTGLNQGIPRTAETTGIENHDPRTDAREMYGEARRDSQSVKNEKDVRFESRGDDNKEVKYDREAHIEPKNDMKIEKDGFGPASSQVNWKGTKEYHRGKKIFGNLQVDMWILGIYHVEIPKALLRLERKLSVLRRGIMPKFMKQMEKIKLK